MSDNPAIICSSSQSPSKLVISEERWLHDEGDVVNFVSNLINNVCQMDARQDQIPEEPDWTQLEVVISCFLLTIELL